MIKNINKRKNKNIFYSSMEDRPQTQIDNYKKDESYFNKKIEDGMEYDEFERNHTAKSLNED